jgi:hypothetical protein
VQLGGGQPDVFFGGAPLIQSVHVLLVHLGGSGDVESHTQSVVHAAAALVWVIPGLASVPIACHQFEIDCRIDSPLISIIFQIAEPAQSVLKYLLDPVISNAIDDIYLSQNVGKSQSRQDLDRCTYDAKMVRPKIARMKEPTIATLFVNTATDIVVNILLLETTRNVFDETGLTILRILIACAIGPLKVIVEGAADLQNIVYLLTLKNALRIPHGGHLIDSEQRRLNKP